MNCVICSKTVIMKHDLYDDRYGYPDKFHLLQCPSCKHKFIEHHFSESDLGKLYTNYYPRSKFSIDDYKPLTYINNFKSWFNGERRSAYTYVPQSVKILDIGCGYGESLGYHKARGCEVYGVEADNNIEKIAVKYDYNVKVGLFDASDYQDDYFDYVTMD